MKLNMNSFTRNIGLKTLKLKKNSPHIFFVGGIVGVVTSGVMACRATLKLEGKLDEIKNDFETVKELKEVRNGDNELDIKAESYEHVAYVSIKSAVVIGKLYGPSVLLGAASIAALTGSHIQLTRRNAALTATVAAFAKAYEEYRVRVQEEIGKERELDIHNNISEQVVEIDGKTQIARIAGEGGGSPYARFFDEGNRNWQNNWEMNLLFLECQQEYMNNRLTAHGVLLLNDVYDSLGMERSPAGAVVGWVKNSKDGDQYVDFGIYEAGNMENGKLMSSVLLDFNVDGVVYDQI